MPLALPVCLELCWPISGSTGEASGTHLEHSHSQSGSCGGEQNLAASSFEQVAAIPLEDRRGGDPA